MTNPFTPEQQRAFYDEVWTNHDPATGDSFATCPNDGYKMTARIRKDENLRADLRVSCPRCGEAKLSRELDPRVGSFREWTDHERQELVDRQYQARPISCPVDGTVLQAIKLGNNVNIHCYRCGNTHFGSVLRRIGPMPLRREAEAHWEPKASRPAQETWNLDIKRDTATVPIYQGDPDRRFEEIHGLEQSADHEPLAGPSQRNTRNMDKRYQVFVSSTYEDLKEERQFVTQALLRSQCIPAGMELFPASDDEKWELIKRVIDDCDYFLLVIGGRYGSTNSDRTGYTEMEYDYAIETKKPVIAFLHGEPDLIPQSKLDRDPKLAKKLKVFRNKASDKRTCEFWTSPADLAWKVSSGIAELKKTRPEGGWIKAHLAGSPDKLQQLQQRIQELETQLAVLRANPERSVRELPSEALDLLSEAAKSGGQIRVISTLTSYHVQVGNRVVNEPKDRQSEGLYRAFLSKLSAEGLIERTSDHIYRLTLEGYELAKNLPKS